MPINQLRILTLPIIGSVIASFLSGDMSIPLMTLMLGSVLPIYVIEDLGRIRDHWFWRLYGIVTLAVVGGFYSFGISIKYAIFFLVYFCLIYELYGEKRRNAPARLIGLLSFLIMLYHARIEAGLSLMIGLGFYLFSLILCLMLLQSSGKRDYEAIVTRGTRWAPLHFAVVVAAGLAIFWIIPRMPFQNLDVIPSLLGDRISGFDERVSLNDIGSLKRSRKHIMDLTPLDGPIHTRYLEGRTLETYSDGVWTAYPDRVSYPRPDDENNYSFNEVEPGTRPRRYRIDLQPLRGNTLFHFETLHQLTGNLQGMKRLGRGNHISVQRPLPIAFSYTVTSSDQPRTDRFRRRAMLQVPPEQAAFLGPLTNQVLSGRAGASAEEKAAVLLSYFQQQLTYTLEIQNTGVDDPLAHFLLEARSGHCELFASSMVLMLRTQAIPARLVTGFLLPPIHGSGDFYNITEGDAHAWVEYHNGSHWVTIDPTPPVDYEALGFFTSQIAALRFFWRGKVMNWTHESQTNFFSSTKTYFSGLIDGLRALPLGVLAIGTALLIALGTAIHWLIGRRGTTALIRMLDRIEAALEKRFRPRGTRETWPDYLDQTPLDGETRERVRAFVAAYQAHRFSAQPGGETGGLIARGKAALTRIESMQREVST